MLKKSINALVQHQKVPHLCIRRTLIEKVKSSNYPEAVKSHTERPKELKELNIQLS